MKRPTRTTYISAAVITLAAMTGMGQTAPAPDIAPAPPGALPALVAPTTQPVLPAGHPSLDQLMAAPTTTPAATGSLTIQALAGTEGAAVPANEPITVELYHRNIPISKIEVKLDATGKVTVPNLPIAPPVQALISIKHGGLLQQVIAPELNAQQPDQSIQMKVFETTEEMPAWNIAMQHMIIQWTEDGTGARIIEMLSASSPIDKAWLGKKVTRNDKEERVTLAVPLPPGADDVSLGGNFDEDASHIEDGKLVTGSAIFPGRSQFQLTFNVPAENGKLELPITTPADVTNLIVFLPADGTKVTATGVSGGDTVDMGEGKVRMFTAQDLKAGATAILEISGIKAAAPATEDAAAALATTSKFSLRNILMGGAFLLVLTGAAMMMMKKPQAKKA